MKVLIVYYSTYGNTYKMALDVPELIPQEIIDSREDMKKGKELQKDIPLVTLDEFREAGAIAFGTPTRFGTVSAQLKNQIDKLSSLWQEGALENKPAGIVEDLPMGLDNTAHLLTSSLHSTFTSIPHSPISGKISLIFSQRILGSILISDISIPPLIS